MNLLVQLYLQRELEKLEVREIQRLAQEVREKNKELEPMRARLRKLEQDRKRMDGLEGFVMVT